MRWFKAASGLLVLLLLVSGCIKVDANIKVEDDGSGHIDFLSAVNASAVTSTFKDFGIPESDLGGAGDICDSFSQDFGTDTSTYPAGAEVSDYNQDGFCGARVTFDLAPATDHSAEIASLFAEDTRLYKEGDNWFFDSGLNADQITSGTAGAPPDMLDALFKNASFKVTIDLPGRAVAGQNNATAVGNDGVFVWDIDILNPPARLFAQTEPGSGGGTGGVGGGGGGGLSPLIIGLIVIGIAAVGALAFFMIKGRSKTETAAAGAAMPITAPSMGTSPPVAATPPFQPGPPPSSAQPPPTMAPTPAPVMPAQDMTKETVVMNVAEAQRFAAEQAEVAAAAGVAAAAVAQPAPAATPAPQPVYDEALGAWVIDDPARGRMRHDPNTDTWLPL